jgi:hypothetical protein
VDNPNAQVQRERFKSGHISLTLREWVQARDFVALTLSRGHARLSRAARLALELELHEINDRLLAATICTCHQGQSIPSRPAP